MECITWCVPILPGKLEAWKQFIAELTGPQQEEYHNSRERMSVAREVVSHMATPEGDFACLFLEGENIAKALQAVAASDVPFDQWFREKIGEIHGLTPEMLQGPLPVTLHLDYRAEAGVHS
jgi:Family of unknown function (DUF6176)